MAWSHKAGTCPSPAAIRIRGECDDRHGRGGLKRESVDGEGWIWIGQEEVPRTEPDPPELHADHKLAEPFWPPAGEEHGEERDDPCHVEPDRQEDAEKQLGNGIDDPEKYCDP